MCVVEGGGGGGGRGGGDVDSFYFGATKSRQILLVLLEINQS